MYTFYARTQFILFIWRGHTRTPSFRKMLEDGEKITFLFDIVELQWFLSVVVVAAVVAVVVAYSIRAQIKK